ncbi:PREDICTED: uncharacterized protein LOC104823530 isoform X1 [Tarenaya hassleriana]|uniref:uncharacterized protein LOC104823530 isoform X1 n=1 Tax=Tarenaya hassleriana TaxID=28532 RepID=UPI00053C3635|nr:PREDICTED: uncharacterized protein LOC104823530 isoform X1 [Tarenaya hassleriana]XP_010553441.1 PREDICTED: uncharacterized protein LOC104823530 isoform X1 [Tarenaya hassleriana]XP_010553442.1 PREDICTED: uncharacterized protein LOC104823530 isoform X1 [Tarenaya hassleriana]XP_010553443.1 PREDICTED: uncharacterized protein LOC104823530 isoform X1 [Tarenaya hassleriana]XP_019059188.1 PREDICTED: uncharacterized protein LOC104823530 isoform X1 [Tarenaya hassleriana]
MMSTDGVELTRTINASLPWKMVAKGSRSSTRRNKKPVSRVAALGVEAAGTVVEGVSESEKGNLQDDLHLRRNLLIALFGAQIGKLLLLHYVLAEQFRFYSSYMFTGGYNESGKLCGEDVNAERMFGPFGSDGGM